jgi:hypothetical protein
MSYHDCKYNCGATNCPAPVRPCDYDKEVFSSSIQSMRAKWWEIWLAIIFGKRCVETDSGMTVTMHYWRGKYYLTDIRKAT